MKRNTWAHAGLKACLYVTVATVAVSHAVFAQDAADAGGKIAEIVVTAQKRSENLMEVAVPIAAFSEQMLDASGIQGVQGLQFATPSVVFPNTGAFNQAYIRGVGSRLLQNGLDPTVATYEDNRYISRQSAINFNFADVERVEVLKGPQGVLFGRNAAAGAIRVITKDVADDFEGYVKGSYGNYDAYQVAGAVNVPINEKLGFRLSGETDQHDGYAKNLIATGRSDWNDRDRKSVRGKIKFIPSDNFETRLSVNYWTRNDNDGNATVQLPPLQYATGTATGTTGMNRYEVASQVTTPITIKSFGSELDLTYHFPLFDVSSMTTYANLANHLAFDGDGTSARVTDALIYEGANTETQEINLTSTKGDQFDWLIGGFFFRDKTKFDTTFQAGANQLSQGQQRVTTKSYAGYGQLKWHINDDLTLIGGLRYSDETKDLTLVASPHVATTIPAVPATGTVSFHKFTPAATLQYQFNPDIMVYATYSQGFKSGGFNYPAVGAAAPPLKPEVLDNYEIGLKGNALDGTLQATLSAYYYDYKNLQVTRAAAAGAAPVVTTANAANAELYGADIDVTWRPIDDLTFTSSVSVQHSEYKNFLASAKVFTGIQNGTAARGMVDVGFDASGHTLLRAPKFSAFLSGTYDVHAGAGKVPVTVSYAYKGAFDFDFVIDPSTSVLHQKGYSLVNAKIGYVPPSERWTVSAFVNNLTNTTYLNDSVAAGSGIRGSYAAPRTYGVELEFKF